MAFKEVLDLSADEAITIGGYNKKTKKENPLGAEGYYLGNKVVPGSKYGPSTLHILQTAKGNLGVWGKTDLNRKLSVIAAGTMVRITYNGTVSTPTGDMHKYKVESDDSNTVEVGNLATASSASDAVDTSDDEDTSSAGNDVDPDEEDEQQNQALLAAERKAKLAALIGNKTKKA